MDNKKTYEELVNCIEQEAIKTNGEVVTFNKKELLDSIQYTKDYELESAILKLWRYELSNDGCYNSERKIIKTGDKIRFVANYTYSDGEQYKFILKHWNEVDKIIKILQYHLHELELKKASEEKGETEE